MLVMSPFAGAIVDRSNRNAEALLPNHVAAEAE